MAINNVKDTQSLLTDIEDWMNNPKFQPQEQNKWFFGEGLSYYTQLCEVVKVLTYLQENFKVVIANEKSLEQAYNEVKDLPNQFNTLSTKVDDLTNTVSDLPRRVQELETKVTKLISDVSSQLTRIETLEGSVSTNTGSITTLNDEVDKIKVKDGEQDVKIEKLQSDVISINAKDISQDSEIASVKSKNQEQDTLIDSNTNKITTLEGKDFLQQVAFNNSATITFTDEGKQEGTQTFSASVTGSIPANLTPNLAYLNNNPNSNIVSNVVLTWNVNENKCYLKKDMSYYSNGNINTVTSRLELDSAWFTINENTLTLKASVLDNYLTKADAPGYADILTTANAKTTYVAKTDATGYNDILTKTVASATYETIENASNYVAKSEAVGYDDILTKTEASGEYETKANASETYETKANASTTYVSKSEAVGYDDILTNANASTTYETKQHASNTYIDRSSLIDIIYPVGSIYMSVNDTEPSVLFGGTWEKIKDRFLLASGDEYAEGATGGEATHNLTVGEMPSHNHPLSDRDDNTNINVDDYKYQSYKILPPGVVTYLNSQGKTIPTNPTYTYPTGNNKPHNNMPPYLVVNIWKRIS